MRGRLAVAVALALAVAGCGDEATSQVIVTIDADPEVQAQARVVDVSIYGGVRAEGTLPGEGPQQVPFSVVATGSWPVQVALAPKDGDASRLFRVIATAKDGRDETLAEVRAISGYVEGQTLWLRLYFDAACLGVDPCEQPDETCAAGECVDARVDEKDLPPYEEAEPDAGAADGGAPECSASADCDDEVACTLDACEDGSCVHSPDDASCTDGPDGWCDPTGGCQYSVCDETTCTAEPCQTAECDGSGRCVRTSLCAATEMCCAGTCVPDGCDDGNPCTDDACGATGCDNTPNTEVCDDGTFCNGVDSCADGSCSVHPGDPCSGSSTCDEGMDACVGCTGDADCPADAVVPTGSCTYPGTCAESGTRPVTVTSYTCSAGTCVGSDSSDTEPCSRVTTGDTCGTPSVTYGTCTPDFMCATTGTRSRTETPRECSSGTCVDGTPSMTTQTCTPTSSGSCDDAGVPDGGGMDGGLEGGTCTASEIDCADGYDDDCDGDYDCMDTDCSGDPACMDAGLGDGGSCTAIELNCFDFMDDDCDGPIDCADPDCAIEPGCMDGGV